MGDVEAATLSKSPRAGDPNVRLACQLRLTGPVRVVRKSVKRRPRSEVTTVERP
jgi:hypothetical protein